MNLRFLDDLFARYPVQFQRISPLESLGGGGGQSGSKLWRFRAERVSSSCAPGRQTARGENTLNRSIAGSYGRRNWE